MSANVNANPFAALLSAVSVPSHLSRHSLECWEHYTVLTCLDCDQMTPQQREHLVRMAQQQQQQKAALAAAAGANANSNIAANVVTNKPKPAIPSAVPRAMAPPPARPPAAPSGVRPLQLTKAPGVPHGVPMNQPRPVGVPSSVPHPSPSAAASAKKRTLTETETIPLSIPECETFNQLLEAQMSINAEIRRCQV